MAKHQFPAQMKVQDIQKKLGDRLYIFESSTTSHRCLITAHGGYWAGTKKFTVPNGVTLHFYAPHGNVLSDPGISFLYNQPDMKPTETITGGHPCYNYILSKYQGRHGSQKETYEAIAGSVTGVDTRLQNYQSDLNKALDKGNERVVGVLLKGAAGLRNAHVVTIRHRRLRTDVNLKYVIDKVRESYPEVTEFHCSHCRSNQYLPS